jgi:voltage-gated potassium channel
LIVFTVEYFLRVWSCDVDPNYRNPVLGRLRYCLTPLAIIDLMVILPFYLDLAFAADHRFLRSLRVLWTFRLLKLHRYSESLQTIIDVIKAQERELAMSFTAIIFFMVLSSTTIYFLEHDVQPQNFPNIPATMWWAVLTMTTIGMNVYPETPLGKVIGGLIIILGVATFALPTSILTSGFVDELQRKREEKHSEEEEGP